MNATETPEGYKQNAQGNLVPVDKIDEFDLMRDRLVLDTLGAAAAMHQSMLQFKQSVQADINAFLELAAEKYQAKIGGKKGNFTLMSYDGRYKVQFAINDTLTFDERLHVAKGLIDECIHEWTKDATGNVKALIEHAFQTDKQGNINTGRVLGLFKLKIQDDKWLRAMAALKDSIAVAHSKSYIRFYERVGEEGKYEQISLDMASL